MVAKLRRWAWVSLGVLLLLPLGLALLSDLVARVWVQWTVWIVLLIVVMSCCLRRREW